MGRLSSKLGPTRPEGTDVVSTGESGGTKFLREDGDGTSSWQAAGITVQQVTTQTGETASGTTTIPYDDTIPQNTEGTEFMTRSITPTNASNKLVIECDAFTSVGAANQWAMLALFQDSTANALATDARWMVTTGGGNSMRIRHEMTAGTTSSTTFKVRAGPYLSGTIYFNGDSGGRKFGGSYTSHLTITEYAA